MDYHAGNGIKEESTWKIHQGHFPEGQEIGNSSIFRVISCFSWLRHFRGIDFRGYGNFEGFVPSRVRWMVRWWQGTKPVDW